MVLLFSKDLFKFDAMRYPHKPVSLRVCLQILSTYLPLLSIITTTACIIFSEIILMPVRAQVLRTMYKISTYFLSVWTFVVVPFVLNFSRYDILVEAEFITY